MHQLPPSKCSTTKYHQTNEFSECPEQMAWTSFRMPGSGLSNKDEKGACKNMCYINSIVQCFANTAIFVQWLFMDLTNDKCKYWNTLKF